MPRGKKKGKKKTDEFSNQVLDSDVLGQDGTEVSVFVPSESEKEDKEQIEENNQEKNEKKEKEVTSLGEQISKGLYIEREPKNSRSRRRKAAKAAKEQEREKQLEEESKNIRNVSKEEDEHLKKKLESIGYTIHEITPDGNCMYAAVSHQLTLQGTSIPQESLRKQVAEFMWKNKEDFMPFMEIDHPTEDDFKKYCDEVANTAAWGGQLELQALIRILQSPITIYQSTGSNIEMGNEFEAPPLRLSYHQHAYSLGEHYNSVVPNS